MGSFSFYPSQIEIPGTTYILCLKRFNPLHFTNFSNDRVNYYVHAMKVMALLTIQSTKFKTFIAHASLMAQMDAMLVVNYNWPQKRAPNSAQLQCGASQRVYSFCRGKYASRCNKGRHVKSGAVGMNRCPVRLVCYGT